MRPFLEICINTGGRECRSKLSCIFVTIPQGMEDGMVSALYERKQRGTMIILHIRGVV